jgi:SAM-dependent methyltransferase
MPEIEFDYEQSWRLKEGAIDAKESQRIRQTMAMIPGGVRTVLDAGCGDGRILSCLAERYRAVGVDVAHAALARGENRERVAGILSQLPFPDDAFDLVVACEVIEHIPERALPQVLLELRRVAKSYILVTVPYRETLEDASVRCPCGWVFHKWGHLRTFDERRLISLYPDLVPCRIDYLGPAKSADPLWVKRIGQHWGGRYAAPDEDTICPSCGGRSFEMSGGNLLSEICHYTGLLAGRLLPARRATWIGGLFQKATAGVSDSRLCRSNQ